MTAAPSSHPSAKRPPGEPAAVPPLTEAEQAAASATGLGLTERRRAVRPLPAPHARESECDSDWAIFQTLISDNQKL